MRIEKLNQSYQQEQENQIYPKNNILRDFVLPTDILTMNREWLNKIYILSNTGNFSYGTIENLSSVFHT